MSCQFSINYPGPKDEIIQKLQQAVVSTGGRFNGDTSNGMFEGNTPVGDFSGRYTINGDTVDVVIDKKPWLVSCSRIESEINNYLGRGTA